MLTYSFTFELADFEYSGTITGVDDYGFPFEIPFNSGDTVVVDTTESIEINFVTDGKFISMYYEDGYGFSNDVHIPSDNTGEFTYYINTWSLGDFTFTDIVIEGVPPIVITDETINNVYSINRDILNQLMSEKIIVSTEGGVKYLDNTNFILNVLQIPLNVVDIGNSNNIKLGDYSSEVKADVILKDVLDFNLGDIEIPLKFNNAYDYMNTDIILHLPFLKSVNLNPDVIGTTINIKYSVDVYTGITSVVITDSITGNIIDCFNSSVGREIPIIMINKVVGSIGSDSGVFNGVFKTYVEVVRNLINNIDMFSNHTIKQGYLTSVKGYVEVNNINLNIGATLNEINDIKRILQGGVFINDY